MSTIDETQAPAPRRQRSWRRLLAAAFWLAICAAAWTIILRTPGEAIGRPAAIVVLYVAITAPVLAIGELLQRTVVGVLLLTGVWLLVLCAWVLMVG